MIYPPDELLDKRSIIQLKIERLEDNEEKIRLRREFLDYSNAIDEYICEGKCTQEQVDCWHKELYSANGKIWDLEADIRKGKLGNLEDITILAQIGRTAVKIRESNGTRVGIKSRIVETTGIGYKDVKINHASQDSLKDYRLRL